MALAVCLIDLALDKKAYAALVGGFVIVYIVGLTVGVSLYKWARYKKGYYR